MDPTQTGLRTWRQSTRVMVLAAGAITLWVLGFFVARPALEALPALRRLRAAEAHVREFGPDATAFDEELDAVDRLARAIDDVERQPLGRFQQMFVGNVRRSAAATYDEVVRRDVLDAAQRRLAAQVQNDGDWLERRDALAGYLALGGRGPRDARVEAALVPHAVEVIAARSWHGRERAQQWAERHIGRLSRDDRRALPIDDGVAASARAALQRAPTREKLWSYAIEAVARARCERADAPLVSPMTQEVLLGDRFELFVGWHNFGRVVVEAPFTAEGHAEVLHRLAHVEEDLARNAWVVPLGPEEQGEPLRAHQRSLYDAYATRQVAYWTRFFEDIRLRPPTTAGEVRTLHDMLTSGDSPWIHLLRTLEHGAVWPHRRAPWGTCGSFPRRGPASDVVDEAEPAKRAAARRWSRLTGRDDPPLRAMFADMASHVTPEVLGRWTASLHDLDATIGPRGGSRDDLAKPRDAQRFAAVSRAARERTERDFASAGALTRNVWLPLLLAPLRIIPGDP